MKTRFDEFVFDPESRQLHRGDRELHLSRKAFDLFGILIEHRPAVVDKETLRERLWGETSVVDANLNNLVSEIRGVLADDPQQPKFLRTVHRVGYAFCGTVAEEKPEEEPPADRPRFWLVWNDRTIGFTGPTATIGRDPDNAIWIDAPGVSRRHAQIRIAASRSGTSPLIEDLASTNGTFVGGRRVTREVALQDGQSIQIGEATLIFRTSSSIDAPTKRISRRERRP
jgi:DNA-binding winged helix-turn-helix (wHTH) protein